MQKLKPGDLVRVRHARCRIVSVQPYDGCEVVTLAGIGGGGERRVIAPFDTIEAVDTVRCLRMVNPRRWRRVCRELLASNTPPGGLRCGRFARMNLLPHQLEPVLAVLRGLGSRLLLADDVGLGKTLQAGLVIGELRARDWVQRVLILTPSGVREQWSDELSGRLGIDATIVDAASVRRRVAALPVGVNPWTTTPVALASIDYVKRADVLPAAMACRWDVVVVDEAHHVAGDSDRFAAAAALCARAAYVLLLTATPYSGDRPAFASLCGIGSQSDDPLLIFRRTRRDVRLGVARRVHPLHVRPSPAEHRMHAQLARFARAVHREHGDAATLALSVLHKRALSSPRSLERSVSRRLAALAADSPEAGSLQLVLPLTDDEGEFNDRDDIPAWSDALWLASATRERRMLESLAMAADDAAAHETKTRALRRFLRRVAEPVIVFTEYRDTLFHLRDSLDRPVLLLHGGLTRTERTAVLAEFARERCTTLLATDAGGEGLNLHHRCRLVVNLELPWNPMRLEQRVGRVDRIGQQRTVHALHLISRDTEEARMLDRLKARVAVARSDLNVPDPIGGEEQRRGVAPTDVASAVAGAPLRIHEEAPAGCEFPHLAVESTDEAARLARVRALSERVREPEGCHPCVVRARRGPTRARLRGRTLLLLRALCDDDSGRTVESTLIPVMLHSVDPRGFMTVAPIASIEDAVSTQLSETLASWRRDVLAIAGPFRAARLRREYAIAAQAPESIPSAAQPGLFDRRADRAVDAAAALHRIAEREQHDRLEALERARRLSFQPPRILLAMTP